MYKKMFKVATLISIILAIICFNTHADEGAFMQIIEKEGFVFETILLTDRELPNVCSLVEAGKDQNNIDLKMYVFGSVQYAKNSAAWVTFEMSSPNNKSVSSAGIVIGAIPGNKGEKIYFLVPISFELPSPHRTTISKADTVLDIKIKKTFFK